MSKLIGLLIFQCNLQCVWQIIGNQELDEFTRIAKLFFQFAGAEQPGKIYHNRILKINFV